MQINIEGEPACKVKKVRHMKSFIMVLPMEWYSGDKIVDKFKLLNGFLT